MTITFTSSDFDAAVAHAIAGSKGGLWRGVYRFGAEFVVTDEPADPPARPIVVAADGVLLPETGDDA
jgi:hypothetical protein